MGLMAKDTGGGDFVLAPQGNHVARCYQVIDLGMQKGSYKGVDNIKHQVFINWELPNTLMEDGQPFSIAGWYTVSLNEAANLRAHLESWRGKAFTKDELGGFELENVIGVPCMINVVHNTNDAGSVRAKISAITPMPEEFECPAAVNAPVGYFIATHDEAVFQSLPEWMHKKINRGNDFPDNDQSQPPAIDPLDNPDDDIPF